MLSQITRTCGVAALLFSASVAFAQVPTHIYELNNSFADAQGGPSLDNTGGATLTATGLSFGAGQGPSLSNAISASNYTIEIYFRIDATSGYRKLIDFKNRSSDTGLYNLNTTLNFFNITTGPAAAFTANTLAHVVITRDSLTNAFVGYVNGVQQISFTDSSNTAVFDGTGNIAHFLRDDAATSGEESAGFLDFIRTYDAPLTQGQVTARYQVAIGVAVPEASPMTLVVITLPLASFVIRRRFRRTAA